MRAGAFSETRVIELVNRRFVAFYFDTNGKGPGRDPAAAKFVKGKVQNKWAHLSVFTPEGEYLGESDVYADKDATFEFLKGLLNRRPEFDVMTPDEETLAAGKDTSARLFEELGEYDKALAKLGDGRDGRLARARIARYRKDWDAAARALEGLDGPDAIMERGYRLIFEKKYAEARALLEPAIEAHGGSTRISEMRFYAGVACWFAGEKRRANGHWCWVVENLPEDRLMRRCYTAAAAEGMPYANPELGGYQMDSPYGSIDVIQEAYAEALEDYRELNAK